MLTKSYAPLHIFCILLSYSSLANDASCSSVHFHLRKFAGGWSPEFIILWPQLLSLFSNDAVFELHSLALLLTSAQNLLCLLNLQSDGFLGWWKSPYISRKLLGGRMWLPSKSCLSQCFYDCGFPFMHSHELELRVDRYILTEVPMTGL